VVVAAAELYKKEAFSFIHLHINIAPVHLRNGIDGDGVSADGGGGTVKM